MRRWALGALRGFAAAELKCMGSMARPAVPSLREMVGDAGPVAGGAAVGQFADEALAEIASDTRDERPLCPCRRWL
jgi:hypothetical protein